ncbi:hypothetical protein ITJ66_02890 [Plantibacter sp. VKM Ac-2885]|uniref:hypothetical protein n=1 Tax=Plantibacter sp. VKM Ac-2885 TaxID=2783828 RepID=UPI00188C4BF1|nr:hypothetical protein [Plantibacter sp. VKM Ac-2885]MBF4511421.1 hypothetical protein [Plantibacter sp. VKM Ac-2885]
MDTTARMHDRRHRLAPRATVVAAVVVVVAGLLAGCASSPSPDRTTVASASASDSATRSGTGEIRHELGPLTDRFPQLATALSATWMSGTMGDERVPGPSTYWIDAIVVLDEAGYAELRALAPGEAGSDAEAELPDLDAGLDDALPPGPLVRSSALDDAFSQDGRSTQVFLDDATSSVILTSRFQ